MLVAKLLPFTENLSTRKWSDSDIVEDIDYLKNELQENFHSLRYSFMHHVSLKSRLIVSSSINHPNLHFIYSTFEEYSSEVETGKLAWSPPHKSEVFWKDNAQRLNEQDYRLLRSVYLTFRDPI